jgi:Gpi18-like mannosyltransferase
MPSPARVVPASPARLWWRPTRDGWALLAILGVAFVLRATAIVGGGHLGDLNALVSWAEGMAGDGLQYYPGGGDANYPPLLYLLWPLGIAFDGDQLRTAIRALSIPFDLVLGLVLFWIGRSAGGGRAGVWAAGLYLLNPAVIVGGPLWGQVDGIGALPMLASVAAIASGRAATAGVLATLAGLIKPQFGVAAFLLLAVLAFGLRSREGVRQAAIAGLAVIATFAIVMVPLGLGPMDYLDLVARTARHYEYFSLLGFNPWAMVFGFGTRDGAWFAVGAGLTIAAIVASLLLLRRRRDLVGLLAVGTLIALAVYYLPTRVHERYLFGAVVFLGPLAAIYPRLRAPFVTLTAVFLATLVYVLGNSPHPAVALPSWLVVPLEPWQVTVSSAVVTLTGLWCAWALRPLFARSEPAPIGPADNGSSGDPGDRRAPAPPSDGPPGDPSG